MARKLLESGGMGGRIESGGLFQHDRFGWRGGGVGGMSRHGCVQAGEGLGSVEAVEVVLELCSSSR